MIEQLLDAKLITPSEFKVYKLFASELGHECLKEMMQELFWEEPEEHSMTAGVLGFYEGRRSVIRAIRATVEKVQKVIDNQHLKDGEHE